MNFDFHTGLLSMVSTTATNTGIRFLINEEGHTVELTPSTPQLNLSPNPWAGPGLCFFQGKAPVTFITQFYRFALPYVIHDSLYLL